jgi:hypothetical protein
VIEDGGSEGCTSEIGVQNHAGGIDDRAQRVAKRVAKLALDCFRETGEGEVQRVRIKLVLGNLTAQTRDNNANTFGEDCMPLTGDQSLELWQLKKLVSRGQLLKQDGFGRGGHRWGLCHSGLKNMQPVAPGSVSVFCLRDSEAGFSMVLYK